MYVVNMGRWADSVIGPFETAEEAYAYRADLILAGKYRGEAPAVQSIAPPLEKLRTYVVVLCLGDVVFTTEVQAHSPQEAVDAVHGAVDEYEGPRWAYEVGGIEYFPTTKAKS